ncbi:DNA repair exonuclease [Fructilactobacillus ixorae]|uniref:DNA repair exonuclease n=1 Tax=Fructilactobacillus ixorae TaxID=1750535 RepID=A0ABY5C940_9LACO|nr:DNA repair exonuclease [Fructilactobacillus ixorae]USS93811.1 DNA repair exonuclease [Fructilactobacillus ixorae]
MKFIHTADLHLDTPFAGIKDDEATPTELWKTLHDAPYASFTQIVTDAIEQQVDFMLIVGDLFDSKTQSAYALNFLLEQLERLHAHHIPVLLSFGNHDFQADGGAKFQFPENVQVFGREVSTKHLTLRDGTTVAISGFSYDQQAVTDDVVADFPAGHQADFTIGMVHGAVKTGTDSHYAPFTVPELINQGYDYWALGHIHKRQQLNANPPINYPGDIQGRHKNEPGEKGYLLVTTNNQGITTDFVATAPVVYTPIELEISSSMGMNQIVSELVGTLTNANFPQLQLVNVILKAGAAGVHPEVALNAQTGILLGQVQQELQHRYQQINAWVYEVKVVESEQMHFADLDEAFWQTTKAAVFNQTNVNQLAKKLFKQDFIYQEFSHPGAVVDLLQQSETFLQGKTDQEEFTDEN